MDVQHEPPGGADDDAGRRQEGPREGQGQAAKAGQAEAQAEARSRAPLRLAGRRWWLRGALTVEGQVEAFDRAGLNFELDRALLEADDVVVFRGQLRLEDRSTPAFVLYPPGFDLGEHPVVAAPEVPLERHRTPNGILCLDHAIMGESEPMSGPEAVARAERLWWLWENDRDSLADEEADAPDPWANYVDHTPATALAMADVDVTGFDRGYIHFGLTSLYPLRGALQRVRATHPHPKTIETPDDANRALRGGFELTGPWMRLDEHPPASTVTETVAWLQKEHRAMVQRAVAAATGMRSERPDLPAFIGFVYPDEGPDRGQMHDAWLFVAIRPDGHVEMPRPFALRADDRWRRQPQFTDLAQRKVGIVGVGALGSQAADLLARAGVSDFLLVDADVLTPGNRIRHELDLADIGQAKTQAMAERIRRVNPWAVVATSESRIGSIAYAGTGVQGLQRLDDDLVGSLASCDLILNATANSTASSYLSSIAIESGTPVLHSYVSAGAWGARVLLQRPGQSACWDCLAWWQSTQPHERPRGIDVPPIEEEHTREVVMDLGCADPTFTGPGFELTAAAAAVVRAATGTLLDGRGWPAPDYDLVTLRFRGADDQRSDSDYCVLPPHKLCTTCAR